LVNDISTICFNLLSSLKINTLPYEKNLYSTKPGWFPDIRVEIVNDADDSTTPENTAQPAASQDIQKPTSSRKRMIIHNQGSPVIIKFGHERK
jgi:hypothetical protein